jgi:Primase C terminal 1 (PriCT-1)
MDEFFEQLFQGKPADHPACIWSKAGGSRYPLTAAAAAAAVPQLGNDPYVAVAFLAPGAGARLGRKRRTSNVDAAGIYGVWLDLDVKPGAAPGLDEAEALAWTFAEPTMVVASGGGLHAWHLFAEPWVFADADDRRRAESLVARWQEAHRRAAGWDIDNTADLARVLRIPNSINTKYGKVVRLLDDCVQEARSHNGKPYCAIGPRHPLDDLLAAVDHISPLVPRTSAPPVGDGEVIPDGQRNNTLASLAGSMRRRGHTEAEILAAISVTNRDRCDPPKPESEVQTIVRSVCRYSPAEVEAAIREPSDDPVRNIPAAEYIPWLAPEGCPACGAELSEIGVTGWFCSTCPPRPGAGKKHLGGQIYQLAGLVCGHSLPLTDSARGRLAEFLVDEYVARVEAGP